MSFSKCSFSSFQFFVKSGFFIPSICMIDFHETEFDCSIYEYCYRRFPYSFFSISAFVTESNLSCCSSRSLLVLFSDADSFNNASFSPSTARSAQDLSSLSESKLLTRFSRVKPQAAGLSVLAGTCRVLDTRCSSLE